jgi:hypothetical protein
MCIVHDIYVSYIYIYGAWDGAVVSLDFSVTCSFWPYHGPGVDSAPSENEYQEHFLWVKAAGAWGWRPHHLHVPNVMEIWEPKPPGTPWATPALLQDPFTFTFICMYVCVCVCVCIYIKSLLFCARKYTASEAYAPLCISFLRLCLEVQSSTER